MAKKHARTRKQRKQQGTANVLTVPELRRAFEHIDTFSKNLLKSHSIEDAIPALCAEWKRTFYREIKPASAKVYLEALHEEMGPARKTRKLRGGAAPLEGAPLDYQTRPGIYIQPAGLNANSYAVVPAYVESGFWNPQPAQSYDPVPGQTRYVTHTPPGMGSNLVRGGGKRKSARKLRGGAASLGQAFADTLSQVASRIVPATIPPNPIQDAVTAFRGQQLGQSPDPSQTHLKYMMSPTAQPVPNLAVGPIGVNLKNDISTN
jgi:hypothetical protein